MSGSNYGGNSKQQAEDGHFDFVEKLQDAFNILSEASVISVNCDQLDATWPDIRADRTENERTEALRKRFETLNFEEGKDYDDSATTTLQETNNETTPYHYELETSTKSDLPFAIFCLFEDAHRIQEFLHDIWTKYLAGDIDYISAAFVTNAGVELVVRMLMVHSHFLRTY